jgi:hypothetical protein
MIDYVCVLCMTGQAMLDELIAYFINAATIRELHILYSSPNISSQIKSRNEVDGACGMHGRGKERIHGFSRRAQRKETTRKTEA